MKTLEKGGMKRLLPSPGFVFIVLSILLLMGFSCWIGKERWYMRLKTMQDKLEYGDYLEKLAMDKKNREKKK